MFQFLSEIGCLAVIVALALRLASDAPLLHATMQSAIWVTAYLIVLSLSIVLYRLSPWHPLARFPGPRLAKITKWWMVHRILLRGGRHTKLQQ